MRLYTQKERLSENSRGGCEVDQIMTHSHANICPQAANRDLKSETQG